jgi:hypothetical protein
MNKIVRSFLIEQARHTGHELISYQKLSDICKLGLDMGRIDHRAEIGRILGAVSSYEYEHDRPLLSALVVRSGDNYEGDGFFKLAEELGFGNWKKLRDSDFDILEINKCIAFWSDDSKYLQNKDV